MHGRAKLCRSNPVLSPANRGASIPKKADGHGTSLIVLAAASNSFRLAANPVRRRLVRRPEDFHWSSAGWFEGGPHAVAVSSVLRGRGLLAARPSQRLLPLIVAFYDSADLGLSGAPCPRSTEDTATLGGPVFDKIRQYGLQK
jgi:hypothetical protein